MTNKQLFLKSDQEKKEGTDKHKEFFKVMKTECAKINYANKFENVDKCTI